MRTKGAAGGDGPPARVLLPTAHGRNGTASASDHGLHIRGEHGELVLCCAYAPQILLSIPQQLVINFPSLR